MEWIADRHKPVDGKEDRHPDGAALGDIPERVHDDPHEGHGTAQDFVGSRDLVRTEEE